MKNPRAIVTGAGGFIGSHFVRYLKSKGYSVCGIDIKKPEFSATLADEFILTDLRVREAASKSIKKADELYMFAADMGGIEYIDRVHAGIMYNNSLININTIESAHANNISKVFFASSACVYPSFLQKKRKNSGLRESDAIPADPDTDYGWEKLYAERLCLAYAKDYGMNIHIARFHNVYGPEGTFQGGREKSPAAVCRKVAEAKHNGTIEVWGDGRQTRSYCYIDDCCQGIFLLMQSSYSSPLNIGSDRLVSVNELVDIVANIANKTIHKKYNVTRPQGVRGRNSDNTLLKRVLHWVPQTSLEKGLKQTYTWIASQTK